jgi:hypothetical protein
LPTDESVDGRSLARAIIQKEYFWQFDENRIIVAQWAMPLGKKLPEGPPP